MHDVFLSYASSDRPVVEQLAKLFEQRGWTTWWDRKLIPGAQFAETIRQALKEARCVVVVWSESSTKSIWVKSEAGQALHESKLVSLCIDGAKLPMPFDQLHALDMTGWLPPSHHPKLSALISAVAALLPAQVERTEPVKPQEKGTTVEIQAAYAPAGGLAPIILNVGLRHEHRSLSVALKEASDNTEIVLEGGEYSEDALVIDKPVTIRASGIIFTRTERLASE